MQKFPMTVDNEETQEQCQIRLTVSKVHNPQFSLSIATTEVTVREESES